ncbi:MAG: hypothetical protein OES84_01655 [Kiritimatiellaceae bacterium]|nr:hypothetical protein [Kiritimatiellaceae bacterium]
MNLPIELKARISEHISHVRDHLNAFASDEQREILDSIETHIHDALAIRSEEDPTREQLEIIIAEMDPPESYGSNGFGPEQKSKTIPPSQQNESPGRRWGKTNTIILLAVIALIIVAIIHLQAESTADQVIESDQAEAAPYEDRLKPATTKALAADQSPIIGKWTAIDFVSSVSEFNPTHTNWEGELELKSIQFFVDGKTDKPWWTWKDNRLLHSVDQSEAELLIVTVNQSEYLFMEWISGDVLINKEKPQYYVFKRNTYKVDQNITRKSLHE